MASIGPARLTQKLCPVALAIPLIAALLTPSGAQPSAGWRSEWDRLVALANREGTVVVAGPPGPQWRQAAMAFQADFPHITVEFLGGGGRDHMPRLLAERRAGRFHWDVLITGAGTAVPMKRAGALDPLRPALILPEVLDDAAWFGGFTDGWMDEEGRFIYGFMGEASPEVYVNRDVIGEAALGRVEDLIDDRWRGKISWNDPRTSGSGSLQAANLLYVLGEGFLRKLLHQGIVPATDLRQQVEWIVRGRFPIAISLDYRFLREFQEQGVGQNVLPLGAKTKAGGAFRLSPGFGCVALVNSAPHPNGARVFLNWLLSKRGQDAHVRATNVNSRRLDVASGRAIATPRPGVKYFNLSKEGAMHYVDEAIALAKEILD